MAHILVVDDEPPFRALLREILEAAGHGVTEARDGAEALAFLEKGTFDLVLTDRQMPKVDGLELVRRIRARTSPPPVVVLTAHGSIPEAVDAVRLGAADYITKPLPSPQALVDLVATFMPREEEADDFVTEDPATKELLALVDRVAPRDIAVLVTGESGTGKELIARRLHARSPRVKGPFVALNAAALPETLAESELFGAEKGAFTGADQARPGRFEEAAGGTLFLDEVGELPVALQAKLLRVLEERVVRRLGGSRELPVDVRLIAATNRDLAQDVRDGRFREDLYYRLNVVHIDMPPLRLRGGDAVALAEHFVRVFAEANHKRVEGLTERARAKIHAHRWPGNVRALENAIERAVVLCEGTRIDEGDLPFEASPDVQGGLRIPGATMAEIERHAILSTLEATNGSTSKAAEILDISVRTIQYRLHEYGVAKAKER